MKEEVGVGEKEEDRLCGSVVVGEEGSREVAVKEEWQTHMRVGN